jgi:hypothetical protein
MRIADKHIWLIALIGREWLVQRTFPKYVYGSLLLIGKGPLVEQRRHWFVHPGAGTAVNHSFAGSDG